jgi:hypothetical protein
VAPDPERLQRLADSVADGVAVDWEAAVRSARDDEERRLVENLCRLQQLAAASRGRATPPPVWRSLRLREPLGHGAFGDVFAAWDPNLQREVALKLVPLEPGAEGALALEEGRLLARVRDAHVVAVYGAEVSEGWAGLWMERIQGRTVAEVVREKGPLEPWDLGLVGLDVSRALAAVHAAGILHCDVKPSNVMREESGRTVLMDFGIGRRAGAAGALTAGTPAFMAPETLRGEPATVRSDVYMVGALLFALATGGPPDPAGATSLRPLRPDLPEDLAEVVERALEEDPERRFPSAEAMAHALSQALGAPDRGRRRRWLPVGLVASVVAAGLAAVWVWPPSAKEPAERRGGSAVTRTPGPESSEPSPPASETTAPPAARSAVTEPFVRPVGSEGPLGGPSAPGANEAEPFSIRAAWRAGGAASEIELRASRPLSVYVVREEEPSDAFLVFPLPGAGLHNPLPGKTTHRLPLALTAGSQSGRLLLIAIPSPLEDFEAAVERSRVPRREIELSRIPLTEEALAALRRLEPPGTGTGPGRRLFDSAPPITSHLEMVQGPWIRVVDRAVEAGGGV